MAFVAWALGRVLYQRYSQAMQGPLRFGTLVSNCGFAGLSLAQQVFGDTGLVYASVFVVPFRILTWALGPGLLSGARAPRGQAVRKLLTNPCIIAIFLGLARGFSGITFPSPVESALSTLSSFSSPMTMISVGAIVAEVRPRSLFMFPIVYFCCVRLVLMPLIALAVCTLLGCGATLRGVCVILTAMPASPSTTLLSVEYGADAELVAQITCLSTVLSVATTSLFMLLL